MLESIPKVSNVGLAYETLSHCLANDPTRVAGILDALIAREDLDPWLVLEQLRKAGSVGIHLGLDYLQSIQAKSDLRAVNEALIELYLDIEDYERLNKLIFETGNFDAVDLALKLELCNTSQCTCIAAKLHCSMKNYQAAIGLLSELEMWKDCIDMRAHPRIAKLLKICFVAFARKG
jgi:hypothetical protein